MQANVALAPELWIFVVDIHRNAKITVGKGEYFETANSMDKFFQGFTDAVLAAQNVTVAIESLDMGAVYLGSILNDSQAMIKLLNLPEYTFPALGIAFGYPDENPYKKPRMDVELKVFENEYVVNDNYLEAVKSYDETLSEYYKTRESNTRIDSFTDHVSRIFAINIENRIKILNSIRRQGFDLSLDYIPEGEIRTMFKKSPDVVEENEFEVSRLGFKKDSNIKELFDKYPFVREYLLQINPRFNKLRTLGSTSDLLKMTMEDLANIGDMPVESLIYMIESRIDEE